MLKNIKKISWQIFYSGHRILLPGTCSITLSFSQTFTILKIADVPEKALYITQAKGDDSRLFVVNQNGQIHIIKDRIILKKPFLDISERVQSSIIPGSEEGLLGLAFHPDYFSNGFFYVNYISINGTSVVSRFSVTSDPEKGDENSEMIILELKQPFGKHNGGHLTFGPKDGMLYIGFGDGGKWGDPYSNAQNTNNLLGGILRIDVNGGDPYTIPPDNPFVGQKNKKQEIWCYGLRNPWRFSFDLKNGDLIVGDVGQNKWEEINWNKWEESKGANYGWSMREGSYGFNNGHKPATTEATAPVWEYAPQIGM